MENVFDKIEARILTGRRINQEDALSLARSGELLRIGAIADILNKRKNSNRVYFVVNRHINYTNVCVNRCKFCAFSRDIGDKEAFTLSIDTILELAHRTSSPTELHIVGGLHPELPFSYYLDMIRQLHCALPKVHLQAFTAVEIDHIARIAGLTIEETLSKLIEAGLGSLPGGGAEIFSGRVREALCPKKLSPEGWMNVMKIAHKMGLRSNATMLYGHIETMQERIEHLIALRQLQDETGGCMSFIPLAYHPRNTTLGGEFDTTGRDDLLTIALSRILLDNFDHVKSFWIMLGVKLAQVALSFGADDLDGTVVEEKITHMAGASTPQELIRAELVRLIEEAAKEPVERDTLYRPVKR